MTATLADQPTTTQETQEEARQFIRDALERGETLNGGIVGDRFDLSDRWGRDRLREVKDEMDELARQADGTAPDTPAPVPPKAPARRRSATQVSNGTSAGPSRGKRQGQAGTRSAQRNGTGDEIVVPGLLIAVAVAAVCMVTAVCAVVSYVHVRELARTAGMGGLAAWVPLGVDGLVVAATASLIVDNLKKEHGHPLAWAGVTLGLAGSLAANVLAVDPTLVDLRAVQWVLAGYAPVALAISGHLLFRMVLDWLGLNRPT